MSTAVTLTTARPALRLRAVWAPALLLAALLWSYWPTITGLIGLWRTDDDYSVGMLVPLVAAGLAWRQRKLLRASVLRPNGWGLGLLLASQLLRFAGIYFLYASAERLSLVLALSGLLLLIAGWNAFRRLIWVQALLLLMLPLPHRVHNAISPPLQSWATSIGVFGLELLGCYVRREGNVLHLNDHSAVMVAEACSGLRMLTAFVVTAAVVCFFLRRPAWQHVVLLVSSILIAVVSNGLRVLVTSLAVNSLGDVTLEQRVHDLAGVLMMPLAVLILLGEVKLLSRLTAPERRTRPVVLHERLHRSTVPS